MPGLLDHTGLVCGCRASASIPCSHKWRFPGRLGEKRVKMTAARPRRAAQMQHSRRWPWDAEAQCRGTYHALAATWDLHMAQRAHRDNTQPQQNPPHPAPHHGLSCKILIPGCSLQKGKGTSYFQSSLLQVEQERCEASLRGSRHWLLPAKKRRNCWGEQNKHSVRMIN